MAQPPPYETFDSEKLKPMDIDVQSVSSTECVSEEGRTLHVYHDNWKGRDGKIYDSDKKTVLYEIAQRNRKPQLTVRDPTSQQTVGTLDFATWTRKMEASLHGAKFGLSTSKASWKSVDVHYDSPAFQQQMTWKRSTIWVVLAITLQSESGVDIARFEPVMAKRKFGRVQLLQGDLTQDQIDEIVFTGLGVMQDTYFHTTQNAGVAAVA